MIEYIAGETGLHPEKVQEVIDRVFVHVHRGLHERGGQNGDYVGGPLAIDLGLRAYLHFIGIVMCLVEDYGLDEPGEFAEYGDRIVPRDVHREVIAEVETWRRREPR
jgi:hypothetical protein